MTTITILTADEKLIIQDKPLVSSGDINTVKLSVTFDSNWLSDYSKSAVFFTDKDKKPYEVILVNDECNIPAEVLVNPCVLFFGIKAVGSSGTVVKTSEILRYRIRDGVPTDTVAPGEPMPDVYKQILADYGFIRDYLDKVPYCEMVDENAFEYDEDIRKKELTDMIKALILSSYPVGAIYMSVSNINPGDFLGGTWVAWGSGRVPVGVSSDTEFDSVEKTGGEKTHILTVEEMPKHDHSAYHYADGYHMYNEGAFDFKSSYNKSNYNICLLQQDTTIDKSKYTADELYHWLECVGYRGGSQAHNNLQPYITCYMWKRTA